jgi:hypothetical protein
VHEHDPRTHVVGETLVNTKRVVVADGLTKIINSLSKETTPDHRLEEPRHDAR